MIVRGHKSLIRAWYNCLASPRICEVHYLAYSRGDIADSSCAQGALPKLNNARHFLHFKVERCQTTSCEDRCFARLQQPLLRYKLITKQLAAASFRARSVVKPWRGSKSLPTTVCWRYHDAPSAAIVHHARYDILLR
eukprot:6208098-Pleurochrysis_carterae.AAC.4